MTQGHPFLLTVFFPQGALAVAADVVVGHLGAALDAHCRRLRIDGRAIPPEIALLRDAFVARSGQERPIVAGAGDVGETESMALAFDYRDAGTLLGVSERQIRRLVAVGDLPAVRIGRNVRISGEDLKRFLADHPRMKGNLSD